MLNIFPQSYLAFSLNSIFPREGFLILINSNLNNLSLTDCAFGVICKNSSSYPNVGHLHFLLYSIFVVLCFTLSSVIHFELIFVKSIRYVSRTFFCIWMDVQLFQHHLLAMHYVSTKIFYSTFKRVFTYVFFHPFQYSEPLYLSMSLLSSTQRWLRGQLNLRQFIFRN